MILAIDPGNKETGYCVIDYDYKPIEFGKVENRILENWILGSLHLPYVIDRAVIERISNYGSAVGDTVHDTNIAIGRFQRCLETARIPWEMVKRKTYIAEMIGDAKVNDSGVRLYLADRFAPGELNYGKGTKAHKGFFYGFSKDMWSAFAIAVWSLDEERAEHGKNRI